MPLVARRTGAILIGREYYSRDSPLVLPALLRLRLWEQRNQLFDVPNVIGKPSFRFWRVSSQKAQS